MDLPTSYGTRALSPFDWHWYAWDWIPIIDGVLLIALAVGLLLGSRFPAGKQRLAAAALALMAANYGVRASAHRAAITQASELLKDSLPASCQVEPGYSIVNRWPEADGTASSCSSGVGAIPTFGSPFSWRLIARLPGAYETREVNVLPAALRPDTSDPDEAGPVRFPNQWTPAASEAATTRTARIFLGFSRFPAVRTISDGSGDTTVQWIDLRFVRGRGSDQATNNDLFTVTVRLDRNGHVLEERLGR
jgi:hypothetical protein